MNKFTTLATGITLAVASIGAFAQGSVGRRRASTSAKRISRRASTPASPRGQLSRREARRLEREQAQIRAAERQAKADGVVTPRERRQLERMQDQREREHPRRRCTTTQVAHRR